MPDIFKISQLSDRTGIHPKTIRYYEQIGLIKPTRAENGYRIFTIQDEQQLLFIKRAKMLGLTLAEIAEILDAVNNSQCKTAKSQISKLIKNKISEINKQVFELVSLKDYLSKQITIIEETENVDSGEDNCSCLGQEILE